MICGRVDFDLAIGRRPKIFLALPSDLHSRFLRFEVNPVLNFPLFFRICRIYIKLQETP